MKRQYSSTEILRVNSDDFRPHTPVSCQASCVHVESAPKTKALRHAIQWMRLDCRRFKSTYRTHLQVVPWHPMQRRMRRTMAVVLQSPESVPGSCGRYRSCVTIGTGARLRLGRGLVQLRSAH